MALAAAGTKKHVITASRKNVLAHMWLYKTLIMVNRDLSFFKETQLKDDMKNENKTRNIYLYLDNDVSVLSCRYGNILINHN